MRLAAGEAKELQAVQQMTRIGSLDSPVTDMDGNQDVTVGDMVASGEDLEEDVLDRIQREQLREVLWQLKRKDSGSCGSRTMFTGSGHSFRK